MMHVPKASCGTTASQAKMFYSFLMPALSIPMKGICFGVAGLCHLIKLQFAAGTPQHLNHWPQTIKVNPTSNTNKRVETEASYGCSGAEDKKTMLSIVGTSAGGDAPLLATQLSCHDWMVFIRGSFSQSYSLEFFWQVALISMMGFPKQI